MLGELEVHPTPQGLGPRTADFWSVRPAHHPHAWRPAEDGCPGVSDAASPPAVGRGLHHRASLTQGVKGQRPTQSTAEGQRALGKAGTTCMAASPPAARAGGDAANPRFPTEPGAAGVGMNSLTYQLGLCVHLRLTEARGAPTPREGGGTQLPGAPGAQGGPGSHCWCVVITVSFQRLPSA